MRYIPHDLWAADMLALILVGIGVAMMMGKIDIGAIEKARRGG